jgi:SAM-dependent methyltransferase
VGKLNPYDRLYSEKKKGLSLSPSRRVRDYPEWYRDRDEFEIVYSITKAGGKLLDVGCGAGRLSIPLAKKGVSVVGIDISSPGVRLANQYDKEKLGDYIVASMYNLPFKDEIFGHAIASGTFEYVRNLSPPLAQISRVTNRRGSIYFHLWNYRGFGLRKFLKMKMDREACPFGLPQLIGFIEQNGLKLRKYGGLLLFLPGDVRRVCRTLRIFKVDEWWTTQILYRINRTISHMLLGLYICPVIWAEVEKQ